MTERAGKIIDMLTVLKENSYKGNLQVARDFTIIKDCKAESFRFVIEQAVAYIYDQEGIYADTDSVKKKLTATRAASAYVTPRGGAAGWERTNIARLVNFLRRVNNDLF